MKRFAKRLAVRLVLCGMLAGMMASMTGCATPAYSAVERDKQISRTWRYESRQAVDDWDELWLLRPPSRLTTWHVR